MLALVDGTLTDAEVLSFAGGHVDGNRHVVRLASKAAGEDEIDYELNEYNHHANSTFASADAYLSRCAGARPSLSGAMSLSRNVALSMSRRKNGTSRERAAAALSVEGRASGYRAFGAPFLARHSHGLRRG